jgi:hypothetical protein
VNPGITVLSHIYSVKGCGGAFHDGDTAALSSISMITPGQTVTGP